MNCVFVVDVSLSMLGRDQAFQKKIRRKRKKQTKPKHNNYRAACSMLQYILKERRKHKPEATYRVYRGTKEVETKDLEDDKFKENMTKNRQLKNFMIYGTFLKYLDTFLTENDQVIIFTDAHSFKGDVTYYPQFNVRFVIVEPNRRRHNLKQLREFLDISRNARYIEEKGQPPVVHYEPYFYKKGGKKELQKRIARDLYYDPRYTLRIGHLAVPIMLKPPFPEERSSLLNVVGFCKSLALLNAPVVSHLRICRLRRLKKPKTEKTLSGKLKRKLSSKSKAQKKLKKSTSRSKSIYNKKKSKTSKTLSKSKESRRIKHSICGPNWHLLKETPQKSYLSKMPAGFKIWGPKELRELRKKHEKLEREKRKQLEREQNLLYPKTGRIVKFQSEKTKEGKRRSSSISKLKKKHCKSKKSKKADVEKEKNSKHRSTKKKHSKEKKHRSKKHGSKQASASRMIKTEPVDEHLNNKDSDPAVKIKKASKAKKDNSKSRSKRDNLKLKKSLKKKDHKKKKARLAEKLKLAKKEKEARKAEKARTPEEKAAKEAKRMEHHEKKQSEVDAFAATVSAAVAPKKEEPKKLMTLKELAESGRQRKLDEAAAAAAAKEPVFKKPQTPAELAARAAKRKDEDKNKAAVLKAQQKIPSLKELAKKEVKRRKLKEQEAKAKEAAEAKKNRTPEEIVAAEARRQERKEKKEAAEKAAKEERKLRREEKRAANDLLLTPEQLEAKQEERKKRSEEKEAKLREREERRIKKNAAKPGDGTPTEVSPAALAAKKAKRQARKKKHRSKWMIVSNKTKILTPEEKAAREDRLQKQMEKDALLTPEELAAKNALRQKRKEKLKAKLRKEVVKVKRNKAKKDRKRAKRLQLKKDKKRQLKKKLKVKKEALAKMTPEELVARKAKQAAQHATLERLMKLAKERKEALAKLSPEEREAREKKQTAVDAEKGLLNSADGIAEVEAKRKKHAELRRKIRRALKTMQKRNKAKKLREEKLKKLKTKKIKLALSKLTPEEKSAKETERKELREKKRKERDEADALLTPEELAKKVEERKARKEKKIAKLEKKKIKLAKKRKAEKKRKLRHSKKKAAKKSKQSSKSKKSNSTKSSKSKKKSEKSSAMKSSKKLLSEVKDEPTDEYEQIPSTSNVPEPVLEKKARTQKKETPKKSSTKASSVQSTAESSEKEVAADIVIKQEADEISAEQPEIKMVDTPAVEQRSTRSRSSRSSQKKDGDSIKTDELATSESTLSMTKSAATVKEEPMDESTTDSISASAYSTVPETTTEIISPKKRGRPKKDKTAEPSSSVETTVEPTISTAPPTAEQQPEKESNSNRKDLSSDANERKKSQDEDAAAKKTSSTPSTDLFSAALAGSPNKKKKVSKSKSKPVAEPTITPLALQKPLIMRFTLKKSVPEPEIEKTVPLPLPTKSEVEKSKSKKSHSSAALRAPARPTMDFAAFKKMLAKKKANEPATNKNNAGEKDVSELENKNERKIVKRKPITSFDELFNCGDTPAKEETPAPPATVATVPEPPQTDYYQPGQYVAGQPTIPMPKIELPPMPANFKFEAEEQKRTEPASTEPKKAVRINSIEEYKARRAQREMMQGLNKEQIEEQARLKEEERLKKEAEQRELEARYKIMNMFRVRTPEPEPVRFKRKLEPAVVPKKPDDTVEIERAVPVNGPVEARGPVVKYKTSSTKKWLANHKQQKKLILPTLARALHMEESVAICRFPSGTYGAITAQEYNRNKLRLIMNVLLHDPKLPQWQPVFDRLESGEMEGETGDDLHIVMKTDNGYPSYDSNPQCWATQQGINTDVQKLLRQLRKLPDRVPLFYEEVNRFRDYALLIACPDLLKEMAAAIREAIGYVNDTAKKHGRHVAVWYERDVDPTSDYLKIPPLVHKSSNK